ncbi:MAG: outer membrane beta-barrel family protein [Agriterribacter sp.]
MISLRILALLLLANKVISAQTISGHVFSSKNKDPLSHVSIALKKENKVIASTITDKQGYFGFSVSLQHHQAYILQLSMIDYKATSVSFIYPDTGMLSQLVLEENQKILAEVKVTSIPPLLIRKSDRNIINIENSALANGFSAAEVLQRSPGVWVDNMGNIRLKGNQPVTIMVNDVVQRLDAEELADYLRALKSDDISRIEIIPNPASEFEAGGSGGIIHIILKKGKKNGWTGSLNAEYWQQADKPYFATGATLNYQHGKLYLSGSVSYIKDIRGIIEKTTITYPDLSSFYNFTYRNEKIKRQQYRLAAVYDLNKSQAISLQSSFSTSDWRQQFQGDEIYKDDQLSYGQATSVKKRILNFSGATLNYTYRPDTSGSMLKVIADFSNNARNDSSIYNKINDEPGKQRQWRAEIPVNTKIFSLQSDYTKVFTPKTLITSGIKYASISRNNKMLTEDFKDASWTLIPGQNNHFLYSENILMLYTSAERKFKHTTIKAGLRAEQTLSKGNEISSNITFSRKYFGLFPSVFIMRSLNAEKGITVTASYSRRLTRPALNELNPARIEFGSYTSVTGNPNLQPQYSNHFSLAYQFIKNHSLEAYFVHTNNFIALSANAGANNSIDYHTENTGTTKEYGIEYSSTISLVKSWTINTNLSAYRSAYSFNEKSYRQTSFYASSVHTLTFTNIVDIDIMTDYRSPYIYTNLYTYGNFNMDIGFSKKILKAKAKFRLGFTDIFNTSREKEWTAEKDYSIAFYRKRPTRTIRISFTCQFSSVKKIQVKNIDMGGQEERRRVGN